MKRIKKLNRKTAFLSAVLLVVLIGVGITVALSVASTDPVVNTFEAGQIDTDIEEKFPDGPMTKQVSVTNNSSAKSHAFVRVRINAPEELDLNLPNTKEPNASWKDGEDGFYYYLYSVAPSEATKPLLDGFTITDDFGNEVNTFDITVYHESCIATEERDVDTERPLALDVIQSAFKDATGTEHQK